MNRLAGITGGAGLALLMIVASSGSLAAETAKPAAKAEAKPSEAELEQQLEAARKRLDAAAREVAEISMSMSDQVMPQTMALMGGRMERGMLGINLGPQRAELSDGVEVASVSPGGPAADAGLKAGDVITEINGKALKRDGDTTPRQRLLGQMRDVNPGDKVAVTYRRDNKVAKATVTAQPLGDRMFFTRALPAPGAHGMVGFGPDFAFMRAEGVFGSAELVPLTPKLGQYFGTEQGLLVVRAPNDSRLKLEDGDVIVDIDGRTPSNPSHALRILGSYQAGEKVKLNVLRQKKHVTFDVTVPESTWEEPLGGPRFMFRERGVNVMPAVPPVPGVPGVRVDGAGFSPGIPPGIPSGTISIRSAPEVIPLPPLEDDEA